MVLGDISFIRGTTSEDSFEDWISIKLRGWISVSHHYPHLSTVTLISIAY